MKLNIIAVGKLSKEYQVIFNDYKKKTEFHASINIIEIKEQSHWGAKVQKLKETELIKNAIPKNSKVYLCSLKGKQYSSEQFAGLINEDNITFVIGGSHGVDEARFENKINFSLQTFPHQLFRVMLMEQVFRAFAIKNGSKYHK